MSNRLAVFILVWNLQCFPLAAAVDRATTGTKVTSSTSEKASVSLTMSDFDDKTRDKSVFIKFFAPWCGHCQKIAPVWEQLATDWSHHRQGLVAEVDCTVDAATEKWCSKHFGINGFPTLLFGDASFGGILLEEYNGDKTYEELSVFAKETIAKPVCSPANVDACDKETKQIIAKYLKFSPADIDKEELKLKRQMDDANLNFDKEFDRMQIKYDETKQQYELFAAQQKRLIKEMRAVYKDKKMQASK